ncbi:phospholipid-binding protein MlaC [Magnetospirillum fulvum]|uniref:Putative ABC transporter n=1 Tax=Magnetospirillum fulvum MGU-K5 TaxID=1316936 RepID=S9TUI0_MAGFU|nr:ABC transporter substrate-binding protein [Magnetospirillum fulvum]EPY02115.1 putative ABC transporter [Magnetospirillum fulvum MGU-K5]
MKILRTLIVVAMLAVGAGSARAADVAAAQALVQSALNEGVGTFASGRTYPLEERTRLLDGLLRRHTEPSLLSAAVLGRFWGKLTPEEQSAFSERLLQFLVSSYVGMLTDAESGITFQVGAGEDLGNRVRIPAEVTRSLPGSVPTPVGWEVAFTPDGRPGIVDLSADGVSLIRAMREDFGSVLRASGGKIEPLMEALQRKIDANNIANASPTSGN